MPKKIRISIPVVVTRNGEVSSGYYWVKPNGECGSDYDYCYDGLSEKGYHSGTVLIHVEAEIDIESVFSHHIANGSIKAEE